MEDSCSTCTSCGSSVGSGTEESHVLVNLIDEAYRNWSIPLDDEESQEWDMLCNDIGMKLAGSNAQSLKPLVAIYNQYGPRVFLLFSRNICEIGIVGHLIAWAYAFAQQDVDKLMDMAAEKDEDMIKYVNEQAELFECVGTNEKVGRASLQSTITASKNFNGPSLSKIKKQYQKVNQVHSSKSVSSISKKPPLTFEDIKPLVMTVNCVLAVFALWSVL